MAKGDEYASAIALVSPYCDIEERLSLIPPSARVRGLYMNSLPNIVERAGKLELYREYFPNERFSAVKPYPLRDYMVRLAVGGAALRGPEGVHQGMHDIWKTNATEFAESLVGRVMLRLLSRDPMRLAEQGLAARRQMFLYGHWEIVKRGPRTVEMIYREEYLWIDTAVAGGAVGTFEVCGVEAKMETNLTDRFNGSTIVNW